MKHWQTILVRVLWSIAGAALIVLFVVAWKAKEEKKCTSIQIELVGENTAALFMDEKEILQIIHEQGVKEGLPIGDVNLNTLENIWVHIYRENSSGAVQVNNVGVVSGSDLANTISVKIVGGRVVSTYQAIIELPKGFAAGNYYIYSFAKDRAGNYPTCAGQTQKYCVYSYSRSLPEARFVVTNDGSGSAINVTEFSLSAKYADLEQKYLLEKNTTSILINSLGNEKAKLEQQISTLNENIMIQKNENVSLKKKITMICKSKSKPKGC